MGQKVHPLAMRLGFIKEASSRWFARHADFGIFLEEDVKIRRHIKKQLKQAAVSRITIDRLGGKVKIRIHSARPGVIIGRHGADIERLTGELKDIVKNKEIVIDIEEVKNPAIDAQLIAENIALQLEKRVAFRRAIKRAMDQAMSGGAKGVKVNAAGRLGGAEIAREVSYMWGSVPLQTFRADIDYGFEEAHTRYGLIGVKIWIYKGDAILEKLKEETGKKQEEAQKKSSGEEAAPKRPAA